MKKVDVYIFLDFEQKLFKSVVLTAFFVSGGTFGKEIF